MPFRSRSIAREVGTAVAVLAIYLLVLLLPLHQAAGLQRDLGKIGYVTTAWSICTPIAQTGDGGNTPTAVKCPAAGIAKFELASVVPAPAEIGIIRVAAAVAYPGFAGIGPSARPNHFGQPRAPPVMA